MLGYTGTFEGRPISVQSTGMGCPSAGIVYEELVQLGATRLVRVGTCGAIGDDMAMADTVIAIVGIGRRHHGPAVRRHGGLRAERDVRARGRRRRDCSRASGATVHVGPIVTTPLFYDPDAGNVARWRRLGHLGIEMEAAMLYTVAAVHGVEALAMMTVSDLGQRPTSERITDADLKRGVDAHDAHRLPRRRVLTRTFLYWFGPRRARPAHEPEGDGVRSGRARARRRSSTSSAAEASILPRL